MLTARQYYDKALEVIRTFGPKVDPSDPNTRKRLLTIASYLQLAVNNSEEPFPDASARLSVYTHALGEQKLARQYALETLRSRPHSFWARVTLFNLAYERLVNFNPYTDNSNLGLQLATVGISLISRFDKRTGVHLAAKGVASAYQETIRTDFIMGNDVDVESYVTMAETLLDIDDAIRRVNIKEPTIYHVILNTPWQSIGLGGFEEIVDEIKARAGGLLYI